MPHQRILVISSFDLTPDVLDVERMQDTHNLFFIVDTLADLHHLGEVFHQTTVWPFRRLARADPAPLRRMQISSFEMGLGT